VHRPLHPNPTRRRDVLAETAPAFAAQSNRIKQRLLSGTVLESDETSVRVGKQILWNWVFHHGDSGDEVLAPGLKARLKRAIRIGRRRPQLPDTTLAAYHSRLQAKLDDLLKIVSATKAGQKLLHVIKRFRSEWAPLLMPTSGPSSRPPDDEASASCPPSDTPSTELRYRLQRDPAAGDVSNYGLPDQTSLHPDLLPAPRPDRAALGW
jgi:hypothetical protein